MIQFKEYKNTKGEIILYIGEPNLTRLEELSEGVGDIWHSSLEQGYRGVFSELVYFTFIFFWYLNESENSNECISWRLNPNQFAIRKRAWDALGGFDEDFENPIFQAFDFAYNATDNYGAVCLYVKGLFQPSEEKITISSKDKYVFFRKNFKIDHSIFMLIRKGIWNLKEWNAFLFAYKNYNLRTKLPILPPRTLNKIEGNPKVSYIIPTMLRQQFTLNLLKDLKSQSYLPTQVVIVDATPEKDRVENIYTSIEFPFEVIVKWQTTKGSCRARNEAIDLCTGEYIIFGDDDIRIPNDFIENHIRLLQTYKAGACNGLDIMADNQSQTLDDLTIKLKEIDNKRWKVGVSSKFSNANSCVERKYVNQLVGNDINYDGGYGEDGDFGISLNKIGVKVLHNPFSTNLHLKPPMGGYRFWGAQAKLLGKKRKKQPWELDYPVKYIRPVPSPTVLYQALKHFTPKQVREYKYKYFVLFLTKGSKWEIPFKILSLPYRILQFNRAYFYASNLLKLGKRTK